MDPTSQTVAVALYHYRTSFVLKTYADRLDLMCNKLITNKE
jgi:hypothetical protein